MFHAIFPLLAQTAATPTNTDTGTTTAIGAGGTVLGVALTYGMKYLLTLRKTDAAARKNERDYATETRRLEKTDEREREQVLIGLFEKSAASQAHWFEEVSRRLDQAYEANIECERRSTAMQIRLDDMVNEHDDCRKANTELLSRVASLEGQCQAMQAVVTKVLGPAPTEKAGAVEKKRAAG